MAPLKIRRLSTAQAQFATQLRRLCAYESALDESADQAAAEILAAVRAEGDAALLRYTERFDNVRASSLAQLEITPAERARALEGLEPNTRAALEGAAARISTFHAHQREESWRYSEADGTELGQRITPLDRVGFYVPGGKAAYPSSVLMSMIPAKVAGVRELIMTVPTPDGVRNALVLAAAELAGVDRVFAIGGAQAIGALAYGTQSVPQVDKIVGPGNRYVAAAKRRVFGIVGIDMIAGPSEILIISDGKLSADWIAADLFSQSEHDELAQAILLCPEQGFIEEVARRMQQQFERLPRQEIVRASVENRGALIHVRDLDEACAIANEIAPEHLELALAEPQRWLEKIRHAGAIFLGSHTSEALGDYCAGPSHVLPTARSARFSSPLGVYDFRKRTSIIQVSPAGARTLGQIAVTLAEGEGLHAHAQSARYRL